MFAESHAAFFADFGTPGTLAGAPVRGLLDDEHVQFGDGVLERRCSYLLQPGAPVAPAEGQPLVAGGVTYTVRQVLREPPDGVLQRLVLARVS